MSATLVRIRAIADEPPATGCAATEPELFRSAQAMIAPAARLLAAIGAPLLTIARFQADPAVRLFAWTDRLAPGAEIDPRRTLPAANRLRDQAAEALRQVSLRWPAYALPPAVGLVTDGSGVAVSGEHPSGLTASWLIDQIDRAAPLSIILPFDARGVWTLLSPQQDAGAAGRRH